MNKLRRAFGEDVGHSGLEQTLARLCRATYHAGRRRNLLREDIEDAAMQAVVDFLLEWAHADAARPAEQASDNPPQLSEEEIGRWATAAAHEVARRCQRERTHREEPRAGDAENSKSYGDLVDPRNSPHAQLEMRELLEAILAILARLPGETGTQFWEHHVGQVSFADLSRRHGCTPEAIRQRLLRAVPHIREELLHGGWDETGSTQSGSSR